MAPLSTTAPPRTPPRRSNKRKDQLVGAHFCTPQKRRAPRKDAAIVHRPDALLKAKKLQEQLAHLEALAGPSGSSSSQDKTIDPFGCPTDEGPFSAASEDPFDNETPLSDQLPPDTFDPEEPTPVPAAKRLRRVVPDEAAENLYTTWLALLPTLNQDYLTYSQSTQGRVGGLDVNRSTHTCPSSTCMIHTTTLTCMYFDHLILQDFEYCKCDPLPNVLVRRGLFPTAPQYPKMAVAIDLLDLYFALFERSADAITALAAALKTMYQRRGFPILNEKGEPIQDPFRRALGYAIQWYDCLRNRAETLLETAIDECIEVIQKSKSSQSSEANMQTTQVPVPDLEIGGSRGPPQESQEGAPRGPPQESQEGAPRGPPQECQAGHQEKHPRPETL